MSFEEMEPIQVGGKEVRVWKDAGNGINFKNDYRIKLPIGYGVHEVFWMDADRKEDVEDVLKNSGYFEDEVGRQYYIEQQDSGNFIAEKT
jgi:hypothetical protein